MWIDRKKIWASVMSIHLISSERKILMGIYEWLMFSVELASLVLSVISTAMKIATKKEPNSRKEYNRHEEEEIIE
jgi:hypothetical protein